MDILDQLEEKVKGAVDKINSLQDKIKKLVDGNFKRSHKR